jgi:hypothetical protein
MYVSPRTLAFNMGGCHGMSGSRASSRLARERGRSARILSFPAGEAITVADGVPDKVLVLVYNRYSRIRMSVREPARVTD